MNDTIQSVFMSLFFGKKCEASVKAYVEKLDVLLKTIGTDRKKGLMRQQIQRNRDKFGNNALSCIAPVSLWTRLWQASTEPMILMLLGAWVLAIGINVFRYTRGQRFDYFECFGIFLAIGLSVVISVVMEGKSAKAFEELTNLQENSLVCVLRNGNMESVHVDAIVVGDIVVLGAGDKVPADGRILTAHELYCDESMLTGESKPIHKEVSWDGMRLDVPLAERNHMVYRGSFVSEGNGRFLVTAVGDATEFGRIASALQNTSQQTTPLEEKLERLGKKITIFGVLAAAIVFGTQLLRMYLTGTWNTELILVALVTSVVLIVAAVPEGLPTIVAVSLSLNIIKLSKQSALVKKMIACETVGCINIICSDKTGTLTENKMTVQRLFTDHFVTTITTLDNPYWIQNICCNTTASIGKRGNFIGNPTECALLEFYQKTEYAKSSGLRYQRIREKAHYVDVFPFSSDEKHMTTIITYDGKNLALVKGSPEGIVRMCMLSEERIERIRKAFETVQAQGMRVIAFAHKFLQEKKDYHDPVFHQRMESAMVFDGFVAIADPIRQEVYAAMQECEKAGVRLKILTGDHITTATAVAQKLGILQKGKKVVLAQDIESMTDQELCTQIGSIAVIARSTPRVKMRIVHALQKMGHIVAVTGDGINDAPALKHADVGIAMGITGSEVAKQASDIVLLNDSFATFVKAIEWGRNIYENFKRFILFQLTVNFASVVVVFVSIVMGLKAPFTALQLLWVNIIMDGPPALTLGLEPNHKNIMCQKPTKRDADIVTKSMCYRIVGMGSFMSLLFLGQYYWNYLGVEPVEESTVLFTFFVLMQLFNSFNCRMLDHESVFRYWAVNPWMLLIVGAAFLLQVLFVQYASAFFGTVPLSLRTWCKVFVMASSVLWGYECVKWVQRQVLKKV